MNTLYINDLKQTLYQKFQDKTLGSTIIPTATENFLGKQVSRKIKTGLIEVGGKSNEGECKTINLVIPKLDNQDELSESWEKIRPNSSGVTALVQGLRKAKYAIDKVLEKRANFSASKNVIFFTG